MKFTDYRPRGVISPTDKALARISKKVYAHLWNSSWELFDDLDDEELQELAFMLVEFGEDTWYEIGLWKGIEDYNREFFGTPLPFMLPEGEEYSDFPFDEFRLMYFLWASLETMQPGHIYSPSHSDLLPVAKELSLLLEKEFKTLPAISSVKRFLKKSNKNAWDVKQKLVWFGTQSYLFRMPYADHYYEYDEPKAYDDSVALVEQFLIRTPTIWSGLTPLEVLIPALNVTAEQRKELYQWYEKRQMGLYQILEKTRKMVSLLNLINNQTYEVVTDAAMSSKFSDKEGGVLGAALVPYNKKWYWSGLQTYFGIPAPEQVQDIVTAFKQKMWQSVYCFDEEKEQAAKAAIREQHEAFVEYFGDDFAVFPTGRALAEASHAFLDFMQKKKAKEIGKNIEELKADAARQQAPIEETYPAEMLASTEKGAIYSEPDKGTGMNWLYHELEIALQKKGKNWDKEEDGENIWALITDENTSPGIVRKLVARFGAESVQHVFFMQDAPDYWLDYLLRKYKGIYYHKNYPSITMLD